MNPASSPLSLKIAVENSMSLNGYAKNLTLQICNDNQKTLHIVLDTKTDHNILWKTP